MWKRLRARLVLLLLCAALPLAVASEPPPADPRVPLGDLLDLVFEQRELIAFGAGGGSIATQLEVGEVVRWHGTRGAVGIVLTDRRLLAVGTGSGSWQEMRYLRSESLPDAALLGERVALIATSRRAVGFGGETSSLVEYRLGPKETLLASRAEGNVAVVVTDRKLLGYSPFVGGFFEADFHVRERLESISLGPNLATITTNRRYVVFRSETGVWSERKRSLDAS
jgi:hypothetical protein